MRKLLISLFVILFSGSAQAQHRQLEINEQAKLADYKMKDVSGKMISLNDVIKENGLLVIFSCNTCPFVIAWEDRYPLVKQWATDNNVGMVLVNSNFAKRKGDDSYESMKSHAEEYKYSWFYTVDKESKLANALGAQTTPHVFLFNNSLKLVYKGAIDDNFRSASNVKDFYLKEALKSLGSGQAIKIKETPPKGCSIKRK